MYFSTCIVCFAFLWFCCLVIIGSGSLNVKNETVFIYIRDCGSILYVGLVHAAPPTQYKFFTSFCTDWLPEGSTSRYTCKEQQISRPE